MGTKQRNGKWTDGPYFEYPDNLNELLEWVNQNLTNKNLYFCPNLLSEGKRVKNTVLSCPTVWADLDESKPERIDPKPTVVLSTSPGRYQALWVLDSPGEPFVVEGASRRIAYAYNADTSGWDLTQMLRIPLSYNLKTDPPSIVTIEAVDTKAVYPVQEFLKLKDVPEYKVTEEDFPAKKVDALDAETVLKAHRGELPTAIYKLFTETPTGTWSEALWSLECLLIEHGPSLEETFVVCEASAVNKYRRDNRDRIELWREVCKAKATIDLRLGEDEPPVTFEPFLSDTERQQVREQPPTFVDRFVAWGAQRSDAAKQYHQAGAFIILSALLAEFIKLPTSFGNIVPNMWFMLLGDTTLTRKTTAMDMAMDIVYTVYPESILATDASIEGLLQGLSSRSGKASIFLRDEFSGMLDAIKRKDYYAGMVEAFTKLYDGKHVKRVLKKETIEVEKPIFIVFAGGIKTRIIELLDADYIINGFVPRFIFIIAEPKVDELRPAGPPTEKTMASSTELLEEMLKLRSAYESELSIMIGDQHIESAKIWDAKLSPEAWERYNAFEGALIRAALASPYPDLYTPTLDRLAKSTLKAALLLAASRQEPEDYIRVEVVDILQGIKYAEEWIPYSLYIIENAGKSTSERTLDKALRLIQDGKGSRSVLMRSMHLTSREADLILDTLEQRGRITRVKYHKGERLVPASK